jgi:hypothetical protein
MMSRFALAAVAVLALAGCATPGDSATADSTKVAGNDCRTVSYANGLPTRAQYQYWNKGRMDVTTDDYRRHHGDCRT